MPKLFDRVVNAGQTLAAPGNVLALQAGRGFAAIIVVLFHISYSIFQQPKYWQVAPTGDLFKFGFAGVEFFFVLSGLIIYQAHRQDIGQPARLIGFIWKRFRRIYPVYWIVLACLTLVFFLIPTLGTPHQHEAVAVIDGLLLIHIHDFQAPIVTVAWTLFHEILFYTFFSFLILSRKVGWSLLSLWIVASVATTAWPSVLPTGVQFYLSPLHLLFGIGIVAARIVSGNRVKTPMLVLVLGAALFFATAVEDDFGRHLSMIALSLPYGIGSAAILIGAIHLERSGRLRIPSWSVRLGDASYSIYLTHTVTLSLLAKLLTRGEQSGLVMPPLFNFGLLAVVAVALGILFHRAIEVPLLRLLRRIGPVTKWKFRRAPDGLARMRSISGD